MQLPISFVFEPPTRADMRDAAQNPRLWVLATTICLLVAGALTLAHSQRASHELPADAALAVTSTPAGAAVLIDGRERGTTPAALSLPRGSSPSS